VVAIYYFTQDLNIGRGYLPALLKMLIIKKALAIFTISTFDFIIILYS